MGNIHGYVTLSMSLYLELILDIIRFNKDNEDVTTIRSIDGRLDIKVIGVPVENVSKNVETFHSLKKT